MYTDIHKNDNWDIVFTNPTAGPWKRLEATNEQGERGEVYRFGRDEERPDIVLVSDLLESILIFEAKDSLTKLAAKSQVSKSSKLVTDMAVVLKSISKNPFWGRRREYEIYNALLWGEKNESNPKIINNVFQLYKTKFKPYEHYLNSGSMLGVESRRKGNNEICLSVHVFGDDIKFKRIVKSLNLK